MGLIAELIADCLKSINAPAWIEPPTPTQNNYTIISTAKCKPFIPPINGWRKVFYIVEDDGDTILIYFRGQEIKLSISDPDVDLENYICKIREGEFLDLQNLVIDFP